MKKLTAGIFTVMLGLCATSGAEAAVASKGYVDTKVGVNATAITNLTQTVETNATTAANATAAVAKDLADYEASNDAAVAAAQDAADAAQSDVDALETTVGEQATAISGINTKLESVATNEGLAELTGDVESLQTQVGEGTVDSRIATAKSEAVNTAATDATTKANQALADAKSYADGLDSAQKTAFEAADSAINATIGTVAEGKTVVQMIADAQTAATYDDAAVKADIAENAEAIAANETAIEGNATEISGLKTLVGTTAVAAQISSAIEEANLSQYETVEGALAKYEQISKLKALAYKDTVGTNDIDDKAVTTAKLADGAVDATKLGANAVTNAAVADGALSQDKINGLDTTLATKMSITNATSETGKYVFTANVGEDGVTDYAWELIERGETAAE